MYALALFFCIIFLTADAYGVCVLATGQKACYDRAGIVIDCKGTGQDGEIQSGIQWDLRRFEAGGKGEIIDTYTGLIWQKKGYSAAWTEAFEKIKEINATEGAEGSKWRLPNINELWTLFNADETDFGSWLSSIGFEDIEGDFFWSSTTYAKDTQRAWVMLKSAGGLAVANNKAHIGVALAVKDGSRKTKTSPLATGQRRSFHKGDDGDLRKGASMAQDEQRFSVEGECVTDNLTGLMWSRKVAFAYLHWEEIFPFVKQQRLCGYSDWRLPNINELKSIKNYEAVSNSDWLKEMGFENAIDSYYYSSTTTVFNAPSAIVEHMSNANVRAGAKNNRYYIPLVRGGEVCR